MDSPDNPTLKEARTDQTMLDGLREKATAATRGPWEWFTSCSWRRLKHNSRGLTMNVIEPFVASDGHPDLTVSQDDMAFIAAANPSVVIGLLDEIDRLNERLTDIATFYGVNHTSKWARDYARSALTLQGSAPTDDKP